MKYEKLKPYPTEQALAMRIYPKILYFLKKERKGKILDIGCAKGNISYRLLQKGHDVHVCDINRPVWEELKWKKVDLNKGPLPYDDHSFDHVVFSEVIEHIENPRKTIREISRVMKKNGILVLTTPHLLSLPQRLYFFFTGKFLHFQYEYSKYGHKALMPKYFIEDELHQVGLRTEDVTYDRGLIPFFRISLPPSYWFGDHIIMKIRKVSD